MEPTTLITDLTLSQLKTMVIELGAPAYRTRQVSQWIYKKLAVSFDEMSDLPESLRKNLKEHLRLGGLKAMHEIKSKDRTVKVLFSLNDRRTIESVYIPALSSDGISRATICISTQVGCSVRCPFCATGQQGFERNLTPGEIIGQLLFFARRLRDGNSAKHVTNVVFMGMGEPLANYENLLQAILILNSPDCFGLGARNMTVSTSGLVPKIECLSKENLQINLAVSLHSSKNDLRDRLVPINRKYPLEQLIPACQKYVAVTKRRISFEYMLLEGVNDSLVQARSLAHLIEGINCHVNLIKANRVNSEYQPSSEETTIAFAQELLRLHIQCTIRHSRGSDIDAGCGQLRERYK